jgi:hypothetical protein
MHGGDERQQHLAAAVGLEPRVAEIPELAELVVGLDLEGVGDLDQLLRAADDVGMVDEAAAHVGHVVGAAHVAAEHQRARVAVDDALGRPAVAQPRRVLHHEPVDHDAVLALELLPLELVLARQVHLHQGAAVAAAVVGARGRAAPGVRVAAAHGGSVRARPLLADVVDLHVARLAGQQAPHVDLVVAVVRHAVPVPGERLGHHRDGVPRLHRASTRTIPSLRRSEK